MSKKIKKVFVVCTVLLVMLLGVGCAEKSEKSVTQSNPKNEQKNMLTEVKSNLEKITKATPETVTSSNPYDYIKNEEFNRIVEMGGAALEVLEQKECRDVNGYVAAIAAEKITGVSLEKLTGNGWETAEQFWNAWGNAIKSIPEKYTSIKGTDVDKIISDSKQYGVFGQSMIKDLLDNKNTTEISSADKEKLKQAITYSEKELELAKEYMQGK